MAELLTYEATELATERKSGRLPLTCMYLIEGLTSTSINFLMNGVVFFTTSQFGWNTRQNLLLMMAQGIVYVAGSLSAGMFARRFEKSKLLLAINALMIGLAIALASVSSLWLFIPILLVATYVTTLTWPLVESLVTEGCDAQRMNRRITIYNITWSGMCVFVTAIYGTVLSVWGRGPLIIPIMCHVVGLVACLVLVKTHRKNESSHGEHAEHGDPDVAAQLASCRKTALWLARISLPALFVVATSLMGMFPKLRLSQEIGLKWATVLASLWMASRFPMFMVLGRTSWWHTRPRLLLGGAMLMLMAFLMVSLSADRIGPFAHMPTAGLVTMVVVGQLMLGVVAGFVFSASLYFGMVLSDGSTDHGGYHEALIGLGLFAGPGLAAVAQSFGPTDAQWPAILAVSGLTGLTLVMATVVAGRMRNTP